MQELEVNIDFDEASRYWNSNKKKIANGCYKYVCGFEKRNGNFCKKFCLKNKNRCHVHLSSVAINKVHDPLLENLSQEKSECDKYSVSTPESAEIQYSHLLENLTILEQSN